MTIRELLEERRQAERPCTMTELAEALVTLYEVRYTGPIVIHLAQGQPKAIELPRSDRFPLI